MIKYFGLFFETIYIDEFNEWFWSVWGNHSLEFSSPPFFFGFAKTFEEVNNYAEEYSLKAIKSKAANEYVKYYFDDVRDSQLFPFLSKIRKGECYFVVVWESMLSFLRNEDPIYFNKKANQEEYERCLRDFKIGTAINAQGNGNYAKYYSRKISAIKAEKARTETNDIRILEFLYTSDSPYHWEGKKKWFRHRIVNKTDKSIFVERLPFIGGRRLPHDWRKNVIFTAKLNRKILETEGAVYSKSFESWFCTYEKMQEQTKKNKASSKTWHKETVIELPKDKISWALSVYSLTNIVSNSEMKKLFYSAVKKHHPDAGGKHEDFIRIKEAYDILAKHVCS